ncbi:MAG: 50S ribosomal protein L17 [Bacillales bacterium]|jgi:large subunit ribosomal protein L17|nr:50S ribosomal protein L17 [Bacillales bacterium]
MSRKNMHGKVGVKFKAGYTTSKDKSMLRNVATALIVHNKVSVTNKVAHQLVSVADHLVTLAKRGDLHARRLAASYVRDVYLDETETTTALQKLFSEIGPKYQTRNGGYTRILRLENRRGDNAPMALVEFVA